MIKKIKLLTYIFFLIILICFIFFSFNFTKKINAKLQERDILILKDYKGKLLPNTQFSKLYLKKIPLNPGEARQADCSWQATCRVAT